MCLLFPTGIIVECERSDGSLVSKTIDLLQLSASSDLDVIATQICRNEDVIKEKRKPQIKQLLQRLVSKLNSDDGKGGREYQLSKTLHAHILPLTNCAFNKSGSKSDTNHR